MEAKFATTVRSAADRLPFSHAQALWLVDVCGCSYDDAAQVLGIDRQVVAGRVHDARRDVRGQLVR